VYSCLPTNREAKERSRSLDRETHVHFLGREPGGLLSLSDCPTEADPDRELRDAILRIALEFPSYGWPRMIRELRRRGWAANHKRVYRFMREDNLLCLRRRKFVSTTDSDHGLPVYPNLAHELVLTGLEQLWVADITHIRFLVEFVYAAVILDAFSRKVIGWAWTACWKTS